MHERIGMLLYQRLGVPAVRETFARLYVNNTYSGLYTIVESPDKAYLDRIYGDKDGHLFKYDYNVGDSPWFFQSTGDDPALYVPHPFKPETHEDDPQPEFVRNFIRIAGTRQRRGLAVEPRVVRRLAKFREAHRRRELHRR